MAERRSCRHWLALAVLLLAPLAACQRTPAPLLLEGATMGTRYHITLPGALDESDRGKLTRRVEEILEEVNAAMSTWRADSEINRVNRAAVGEWLALSGDFVTVLEAAIDVGGRSRGAYDVTVAPLVNLWGFGPERGDSVPESAAIADQQALTGIAALELDTASARLRKQAPRQLDFSSLAKGYAVDRVALWLESAGVSDYLVEIGGEIRVAGNSPRGSPWKLAVERPQPMGGEPIATLSLARGAVATSGDYRNFFEAGGVRYSHLIDPRSGYPAPQSLASVTVVADSALYADAWATALTVLGLEQALEVAGQEGLAAFLVSRGEVQFTVHKTSAIDAYIQ